MNRWLLLILLASACSTAPARPDDPLRDDGAWNAANAQMERHFEQSALPPTLDVPINALEHLLNQKVARHRDVRGAFEELYVANDLTVRSAATLRVGQLELNFACELALLDAPDDFTASERELMREMIADRTTPFFASARRFIGQASRMGSGPYATAAAELFANFPTVDQTGDTREYCGRTRAAWSRPPSTPFDSRMVSSCEAGNSSACYVASMLVENDRLSTDYAERACANGIPEACAPTPGSTCEAGSRDACWSRAAIVRPQDFNTYTRYCSAGSGFDCFRRGLLLERGTAMLDRCADSPVASAGNLDDARKACSDGEVEACFQLGVATYTVPRELEELPPTDSAGTDTAPPEFDGKRDDWLERCIQDGDRAACAATVGAFLSGDGMPESAPCAARVLFETCRPETTEWCHLFDRFENK